MRKSIKRLDDIVTEALIARGWAETESKLILSKVKDGGDFFGTTTLPLGKYKGQMLLDVYRDDEQYLHWLSGQEFFTQQYPLIFEDLRMLILTSKRG